MADDVEELKSRDRTDQAMKWAYSLFPRMESLPPKVEQGSALAGDDKRYSLMPTSHLAWIGLSAAIEHFYAASLLWNATDQATMPSAYSSLLRPALVGAGQAYWLLAPTSRDERVHRTLLLAREDTQRARALSDDVRRSPGRFGANDEWAQSEANKMLTTFDKRLAEIDKQIDPSRKPKAYSQTTMIEAVAARLSPTDRVTEFALLYMWRTTSGDAHALMWQKFARGAGDRVTESDGHNSVFRDEQSHAAFGMNVAIVKMVLERALELHELRRQKHR